MRLSRAILLCVLLFETLAAQTEGNRAIWIFFQDKPAYGIQAADAQELGISPRTLWRRSKVLAAHDILDNLDIPVNPQYVNNLRALGVEVRAVSRWLNAVSVKGSSSQLAAIRSLPFVRDASPVALFRRPPLNPRPVPRQSIAGKTQTGTTLSYGISLTQLANIQVPSVHDLSINGFGTIVGMVDDGYNNHRVHAATRNNNVLAEYDFIQGDSNTSIQSGDVPGQGDHGMFTYSALSGFKEDTLIGPAYGASFLLAKTEVIGSETPVEEDYYVQGLEWLEQSGADLVSSSLGYIDWYTYDSLDGQTAVTTKAALIAMRKGVLLVTAMGNEGWYRGPGLTGTLIAPADADSIVAVGAVHSFGEIAGFSSTGPTFDGRIKPEVVAQGVSVVSAYGATTAGYASVSGTSLSTPLVAGVAALVLSAHPQLTPMQVREALIQTATHYSDTDDPSRTATWPNNFYGHGMVNALAAVTYHGIAFSNKPMVTLTDSTLTVYISIASNTALTGDSLFLYFQGSPAEMLQRVPLTPTQTPSVFTAEVPLGTDSTYPRGYFSARDNGGRTRSWPFSAPDSTFKFQQYIVSYVPGVNEIPENFVLNANFPNPFNSSTNITFDAPGAQKVEVVVFNILGQKIRTLFSGTSIPGRNTVRWDGKDDAGRNASTGVYFFQLRTPASVITNKMVMTR